MEPQLTRQQRYYLRNRDKVIARSIQWRKLHPERTKEIDRKTYYKNRDKNLKSCQGYFQRNKKVILEKKREFYRNNPAIVSAWNQTHYRIPIGQKCEQCGSTENLVRHHPDYSKPLEVITLCRRCHKQVHKPSSISVMQFLRIAKTKQRRDNVHDRNRRRRNLSDCHACNVAYFFGLRVLLQTRTTQMGIADCTYPFFGGSQKNE